MMNARLIERLLRAAESWGRNRYREDVVVAGHTEPECCADGRVTAIVELERASSGASLGRTKCSVIMEPDGKVTCLEYGSETN